jgi:hypothetical protein
VILAFSPPIGYYLGPTAKFGIFLLWGLRNRVRLDITLKAIEKPSTLA